MPTPTSRGGVDYPDFGTPGLPHSKQVNINLSELAVRLGSGLVYEQWGNLLIHTHLATGYEQLQIATLGANADIFLSATKPLLGPYCVKLTNNGAAGNASYADLQFAWGYLASLGYEAWFRCEGSFKTLSIQLGLEVSRVRKYGRIVLDNTTSTISYLDSTNNLVEIIDLGAAGKFAANWKVVKLVCDFVNGNYVRFLYGGDNYSLSSIPLYEDTFTDDDYLQSRCYLTGGSGSSEAVWLDNFSITANEPL